MTRSIGISLILASLSLLPAATARAASISIAFDEPALQGLPGQTLTFTGTITNLEAAPADLNGCDVNLPGNFVVDCTAFFANAPLSLGGGATSTDFTMFTITVDSPFPGPFGLQSGNFTVLGGIEGAGGYDPSTQNVLGEAGFSVESVPEPRSSSLLALSLGCILWMRSSRCGLGNRIKRITGGEL
jgi:hypothetical protein